MHLKRLITSFCLALLLTPLTGNAEEALPIYDKWGGDFTLTDQNGLELSLGDFQGKVVLLTFGYTHCPDICPNTMLILKNVIRKLGDDGDKTQVLWITLDPERDYPERLKTFVEFFNPAFAALTGTEEQIAAVAKPYGMKYEKEFYEDSELGYSVAHSNVIYLIDQQGLIRSFFKLSAPPQRIADDIKKLLASK